MWLFNMAQVDENLPHGNQGPAYDTLITPSTATVLSKLTWNLPAVAQEMVEMEP